MKKTSRNSLLLVFVFLMLSEAFCKLTQKMKDTEVKVGSSTFLNCSTDDPSREIRWFHYPVGATAREYVYAWKEVLPNYQSRYEVEIDREKGSFKVVIRRAEVSDAGRFLCWDVDATGEQSSAELVVLESDPVCVSNIKLDELIGENSCGVKQDAVELQCSATYRGNRGPQLRWKRLDRPDEVLVQSGNSTHGVSLMRLNASLNLIGSSFVCEAQNAVFKELSCNSTITRVLHALENKAEIFVEQNTEVFCEVDTNCQSCSYTWVDDRGQQVSARQNLTVRRLGSHQCKAKCRLRNKDCEIVAKQIYVNPRQESAKDQTLWLLMLLMVLVVLIAGLILVGCLYRKHRRNIADQMAEIRRFFFEKHPEHISYRDDPIQVSSISAPSKVRGVTVLGQSVFVVHLKSNEIQEFHSDTYAEKRLIDVPGLVDPWDIVSSSSDDCLYLMDGKDSATSSAKEIFRVGSDGEIVARWRTKKNAGYLSVTEVEGNVILAVFKKNVLKEFSPKGELVRKIRVSATGGRIIHPHHAFKWIAGHYLVIHGIGDSLHRVCIVNDQGSVIKTFGGRKGCSDSQMNLPKYLAVDRAGSVMVLDQNNNRVLLLDYDLRFKRAIIGQDKNLENPSKIHLDERTGRLLVTQGDCIRVFDVLRVKDETDGVNGWAKLV